jgi:formylglycine-generating enzyme required for sulfatase activity
VRQLCGVVWQWTESEHHDGHTRYSMLRGGSAYRLANGASSWYFEHGPQPVDHACKLLLVSPAADRFSSVGFRCAVDLATTAGDHPQ